MVSLQKIYKNRTAILIVVSTLFFLTSIVAGQTSGRISIEAESASGFINSKVESDDNASSGSYLAFNGTAPPEQTASSFFEDFTGNNGLERFRYGVYHRHVGHREIGQIEPFNGVNNNALANGNWTGDHDLNCGSPDTQRPLSTETIQDKTGANGWLPRANFHVAEVVYLCRDHFMSSMGDVSGGTVVWIAPNVLFDHVDSLKFKVNLTDLGPRKWWKVGVISDRVFNSTYQAGWDGSVTVPGFLVSDAGAIDLRSNLEGPDYMYASWSGAASAGYPGCLKIGDVQMHVCTNPAPNDKATRFPVSFVDNKNGTVTFTVNGVSATRSGSFPQCPCGMVLYDVNYNPDKDGVPIGHTWHWDDVQIN